MLQETLYLVDGVGATGSFCRCACEGLHAWKHSCFDWRIRCRLVDVVGTATTCGWQTLCVFQIKSTHWSSSVQRVELTGTNYGLSNKIKRRRNRSAYLYTCIAGQLFYYFFNLSFLALVGISHRHWIFWSFRASRVVLLAGVWNSCFSCDVCLVAYTASDE